MDANQYLMRIAAALSQANKALEQLPGFLGDKRNVAAAQAVGRIEAATAMIPGLCMGMQTALEEREAQRLNEALAGIGPNTNPGA